MKKAENRDLGRRRSRSRSTDRARDGLSVAGPRPRSPDRVHDGFSVWVLERPNLEMVPSSKL